MSVSNFEDAVMELHLRVSDFQRAYKILNHRYPAHFPIERVSNAGIKMAFAEFMQTGAIRHSPAEVG